MSGFRKHGRRLAKCLVRLSHTELGELVAETRDISETGVFLNSRDLVNIVNVGERFNAKLYNTVAEKAVSETRLMVVRLTDDGVGLAFE
ncbi:MAG: PilZ domain-containing protein [Cellvibrionaceae bacterium]|nr:PilZ domain-containing protein [Cellvibrionaceae bacterium]